MQKQQRNREHYPPRLRSTMFATAHAAFTALILYHAPALAVAFSEEGGTHGVLHVHGSLTESPCRLMTSSVWQEINMGNIETAQLHNIGDHGTPVKVELKLKDCPPSTSYNSDTHTGNRIWAKGQSSVYIHFVATMDKDNPHLIQVEGAHGLALRLTDMFGKNVPLGDRTTPRLLIPGQDQLTYTITPERTRANISTGRWSALINIGLNYE